MPLRVSGRRGEPEGKARRCKVMAGVMYITTISSRKNRQREDMK